MIERQEYLSSHCDGLRKLIMLEPRGHRDMFGALLTQPVSPDADLGVIFMDGDGYLRMCGHGSIGAVTTAIELGLVSAPAARPVVTLDTPAGSVNARVTRAADGSVKRVAISGIPACALCLNVEVGGQEVDPSLPDTIHVDIAMAGNVFALAHMEELGGSVNARPLSDWVRMGMKIRNLLNKAGLPGVLSRPDRLVELVEFAGPLVPVEGGYESRNMVVFGKGQIDRSPCGTGTMARLSTLYAKGLMKCGQELHHVSMTGIGFSGKILSEIPTQDGPAIIAEIEGSAHITGFNNIVLDASDPFREGFHLEEWSTRHCGEAQKS